MKDYKIKIISIGSRTDLRYIQALLGHKNSKTTEIYTHVSNRTLKKIKSPLNNIKVVVGKKV